MKRVMQSRSFRTRAAGVGIAVVTAISTVVLTGSCFFDTKTAFCGTSGLRCPPGWVCSLEQDACIEAGTCGDGVVTGLEACDDGNRVDGDGCSADCRSDETCGNGVLDVSAGESCDDGNVLSGDNCSPDCKLEACSNRVVDVNEECDSGGLDTRGCNFDCTFVRCGDKHVNSMADEQCDDGMDPSPTCNSPILCKISQCGDSYFNPLADEDCDTGGDTPACNGNNNGVMGARGVGSCRVPSCGDSYTNSTYTPPGALNPETCDTGGVDNQECNGSIAAGQVRCAVPVCGDGYTNENYTPLGALSVERCDTGGVDTQMCNGSAMAGNVRCAAPKCGDGYVNTKYIPPNASATEECDTSGQDTDQCNGGKSSGIGSCRKPECGDGYVNPAFKASGATQPEGCDPGKPSQGIPAVPCQVAGQICTPKCECT